MYARPTLTDRNQALTFGVSGKLWRNAVILYDRETLSLWSQLQGRAVAGPRDGEALAELPSVVTTWERWKERYPDTLVLVKPPQEEAPYGFYYKNDSWVGMFGGGRNPDRRLQRKSLVFGLNRAGRAAAIPMSRLLTEGVLNLEALDSPLLFVAPEGQGVLVYERAVAGRVLHFEPVEPSRTPVGNSAGSGAGKAAASRSSTPPSGELLRDLETGSHWRWDDGLAISGELEGERLSPVPGTPVYWVIWVRNYPDTDLLLAD